LVAGSHGKGEIKMVKPPGQKGRIFMIMLFLFFKAMQDLHDA